MAHSHASDENYFLDQIFAIGLGGGLGAISIMLYLDKGPFFVADRFRLPVFIGGVALVVVVLIRAVAVWNQVGKSESHSHDHDHEHAHDHHHDHDHDHAHDHHHDHAHDHPHDHNHGHDHGHHHDHDHSHGWAPWRYVLLLLPIALYFMKLPKDLKSEEVQEQSAASIYQIAVRPTDDGAGSGGKEKSFDLSLDVKIFINDEAKPFGDLQEGDPILLKLEEKDKQQLVTEIRVRRDGQPLEAGYSSQFQGTLVSKETKLVKKRGIIRDLSFIALENASKDKRGREYFQGRLATLIGQFRMTGSDKQFGLTRRKQVCCATDSIPLKSLIMIDPDWQGAPLNAAPLANKWVEVTGRIYFFQKGSSDEYTTAFIIFPDKDNPPNALVREIPPPPRDQWFLE